MKNKILLIGSCQTAGYGFFLNSMCPDTEFEAFQLETLAPEHRPERIADLMARKHEYDAVLSPPLSELFLDMAKDKIRESFSGVPVYIYTNVYFSGTTPDLTYIGGFAGRCTGPMGDYHSKIVLTGFMKGLDQATTRSLFNSSFMAKLDLFNEYKRSQDRLVMLDAQSDIQITDMIFSAVKSEMLFFANNHPTTKIFFEYAKRISQRLAADKLVTTVYDLPWNPLAYPNTLAYSSVFPVYPEVALEHGLSYSSGYYFKSPDRPHLYSLNSFIEHEYAALEAFGRDKLEQMPQWIDINKTLSTAQ